MVQLCVGRGELTAGLTDDHAAVALPGLNPCSPTAVARSRVFASLPGVPQMRCLPVWGRRDDALAGQLTLHAVRAPGHIAAIDLPVLDYVAPRMLFDI